MGISVKAIAQSRAIDSFYPNHQVAGHVSGLTKTAAPQATAMVCRIEGTESIGLMFNSKVLEMSADVESAG